MFLLPWSRTHQHAAPNQSGPVSQTVHHPLLSGPFGPILALWGGTEHPFITPSESVGNSTAGDKLHNKREVNHKCVPLRGTASHTFSLIMATRSRIGIELNDGSILSAYHHWDGYPTWLGRILETHYNTKEKVADLIDGGDMSSCWSDTVWGKERTDGNKYGPEYYSARGEDCPPRLDAFLGGYLLPENSEEYAYVFRNGKWVCYDMHQWEDDKLPEVVEIPSGALAV